VASVPQADARIPRELKRTGDLAGSLHRHSIAYGHDRLTIQRFLLAQELGMKDLQVYEPLFHSVMRRLTAGTRSAAGDVQFTTLHARTQQAHVTNRGMSLVKGEALG
jgi:hypothetical protein